MDELFKKVPTFEWKEIDGKKLVMKVFSADEYTCLYGIDEETKEIYVFEAKIIG